MAGWLGYHYTANNFLVEIESVEEEEVQVNENDNVDHVVVERVGEV